MEIYAPNTYRDDVNLFVISGPSGAGKTVVCGKVLSKLANLKSSVSATTRAKRPGEIEGVDYHFFSSEKFESEIAKGGFIEWASVHGNFYGTPRSNIEKAEKSKSDLLLEIDVQGARTIRANFEDAVLVFIMPPSLQILEERLRGRDSDAHDVIKRRLEEAPKEMQEILTYDYAIVNNNIDESVDFLKSIICSHRCRIKKVR